MGSIHGKAFSFSGSVYHHWDGVWGFPRDIANVSCKRNLGKMALRGFGCGRDGWQVE